MNLWQRIKQAFRQQPSESKVSPYVFVGGTTDRAQPNWNLVDYPSYVGEGFNLNTLIYSAIMYKVRAQTVAPLKAWEGDPPDETSPDSLLAQLIARPNPHQSFIEFYGQAITYLNVSGDSFTFLDRPRPDLPPQAMYNLRPDRVWIIIGRDDDGMHTVKGYVYSTQGRYSFAEMSNTDRTQAINDGKAYLILPSDMMHVKFPNPGDNFEGMGYGLSPISPLARSGDVDNSITHYLQLFFNQGVMVPGVLSTDQPLDDKIAARIKERWKEMYGGYIRWSEEVTILERGLSYERVGLTFDEMGFTDLDERNEARILQAFGVPPIIVGSRIGLRRSTYSNAELARRQFWQDTMVPENTLFEREFQYFLNTPDEFVAFDYRDVPAFQEIRDQATTQALDAFKAGAITRNEYRRVAGYPTIEGPDGDELILSPAMFEVPLVIKPPDDSASQEDDMVASATDEDRKLLPFPTRRPVKKKTATASP